MPRSTGSESHSSGSGPKPGTPGDPVPPLPSTTGLSAPSPRAAASPRTPVATTPTPATPTADRPATPGPEPVFETAPRQYEKTVDRNGKQNWGPAVGKLGRLIQVKFQSNTIGVRYTSLELPVWWRYSVTITPIRKKKEGDDSTPRGPSIPPKSLLRKIWQVVEEKGQFDPIKVAYDGRFICYSPTRLPPSSLKLTIELPDRGEFSVILADEHTINSQSVADYIAHEKANHGEVSETLAAINTIFSHAVAQANPSTKSTFYIRDAGLYGLDRCHERQRLEGGLELWRGFFLSVRPSFERLTLNVDTTSGAFVQSGNLKDLIISFRGRGNQIQAAFAHSIDHTERIRLGRLLAGCSIKVMGPGGRPIVKGVKVRKGGSGLSKESVSELSFVDGDGNRVTIEEYWKKVHGVRLQYRELGCLQVRPNVLYPVELIEIDPGHRLNGKLSSNQQLAATTFQTLAPQARLKAIQQLTTFNSANSITSLARPFLDQFHLELSSGASLDKHYGRVLQPPTIEYATGTAHIQSGAWKMARGRDKFFDGARIRSIAIIVSNQRDISPVCGFLYSLLEGAGKLGMNPLKIEMRDEVVVVVRSGAPVPTIMHDAVKRATAHFERKPDMIFWCFNVPNDECYNPFKMEGVRLGIATQALQQKNLKKGGDLKFIINMAMKMNAKLGGENFRHAPETTGGAMGVKGWLENTSAMVFGADLTHQENAPSLAAMVGSMDSDAFLYEEALSVQKLVKPFRDPDHHDPGAKAKKQEMIVEMRKMTFFLLERRYKYTNRLPPTTIMFLRDGVSDSEFNKVLHSEVKSIKDAFEDFRRKYKCPEWQPKLVYIVTVKRHHVRFFGDSRVDGQSVEGKSGNIPAGTVVDNPKICDPNINDWYGAAHTGLLGTSRPTRYVVLVDETKDGLKPDTLQPLMNSLCHSYERCNRAVSIPAPVYYADLIAYKARSWLPYPDTESDAASSFAGHGTDKSHSKKNDERDHESNSIFTMSQLVLDDMEEGRNAFRGVRRPQEGRQTIYDKPRMWWM